MSLAAETRRAAAERPFLVDALRAGVVNYTAAARFLDVDGDPDAVATALRRYAEDLPVYEAPGRDVRVSMQRGVGECDDPTSALLVVGGVAIGPDAGEQTAILATGDVDGPALSSALDALALDGTSIVAAGVAADSLLVVVDRLAGADAIRSVERALESVPSRSRASTTAGRS